MDHSLEKYNLAYLFCKWLNRLTSSVFKRSFPFCRSKKSALASLKSGHRKVALRHARELKVVTESREKCTSLLNRVEEVLNTIADSESTKMVSEAIKTGARVMKDIKISADDVHDYLEELEETIESQKQVEKALGKWCFVV
jgi:charged multivesicular body protein 7